MKRAIKILLAAVVTVAMFAVVTIFASADTFVDSELRDYYFSDEVRSYSPHDDPDTDFEAPVVYIERWSDGQFYSFYDLLLYNIDGDPSICGSSEGYHFSDTETFFLSSDEEYFYSNIQGSFTCWYDSSYAITFVIVDDVSVYLSQADNFLFTREFDMDILITSDYATSDHSSHTGYYCEPQQTYRKVYFESGFNIVYWNDFYHPEVYGFEFSYVCGWFAAYDCFESTDEFGLDYDGTCQINSLDCDHFTLGCYLNDRPTEHFYFDVYVVSDPSDYIKTSDDTGDSGGDDGGDGEIEIPGEIPGLDGPGMGFGQMHMFLGEEGSYVWYSSNLSPVIYADLGGISVSVPVITVDSNTGFINECLPYLFEHHLIDVYGHSSGDCTPLKVYVSTFYELGVLQTKHYNYSQLVDSTNIYSALFGAHGYYLVTIVAENSNCSAGCDCNGYSYFSFYVISQMGSSEYSFSVTDSVDSLYQSGYDAGYGDGLGSLEGSGSYDEGFADGFKSGESYGYQNGYDDGEAAGFDRGYTSGHEQGLKDGEISSSGAYYDEGYSAGYKAGCNDTSSKFVSDKSAAYTQGFQDGMESVIDTPGDAISGFFYGISGSTINVLDYTTRNIHVGSVSLFRIIEFFVFVVFGFFVVKFIIKAVTSLI